MMKDKNTNAPVWDWPYPRYIAHRGAGFLAPENTLAAFRLGADYGYRMFECDVKLSLDGIPFLLHDNTLCRTSNGTGIAGNLTWETLSLLDCGAWHSPHYAGEKLPTFESIAHFCLAHGYALNIELKPTEGTALLERHTGEIVARHACNIWQSTPASTPLIPPLISSFKPESLVGAYLAAPQLPRGLLLENWWHGWLQTAIALNCCVIICNHHLWDNHSVQTVKSKGMKCLSYTVDTLADAHRVFDLGTDGIITNRVDLFTPHSNQKALA